MLEIRRKRFVITQNNDTEIFCGLANRYTFKKIDEIGDTPFKTYFSRKKAIDSFNKSWSTYSEPQYNCVEIEECLLGV